MKLPKKITNYKLSKGNNNSEKLSLNNLKN